MAKHESPNIAQRFSLRERLVHCTVITFTRTKWNLCERYRETNTWTRLREMIDEKKTFVARTT